MELRKNYLKIQRRYDYSLELNFVGGGGKLIAFGDVARAGSGTENVPCMQSSELQNQLAHRTRREAG